ncbi:MAG: HAD family hydrolase [Massiliimalia sp.]|jgi:HAD superfamily hydrolase (TIGR01549 family)
MKHYIIFLDSGDTLVDESTEVRDDTQTVIHSQLFDGAKELVQNLKRDGYRIALVADGTVASFDNIYREQDMEQVFEYRSISEQVGHEKPHPAMFLTAMEGMNLSEEDRSRIIMVGNNLKRDIVGANRQGFTSILMGQSPRYCMTPQCPEEVPDYVASCPKEVYDIVCFLESQYENREKILKSCKG